MKIGDYIIEVDKFNRCYISRVYSFWKNKDGNNIPLTNKIVLIYKNYRAGQKADDWEDIANYLCDCLERRPTKRAADECLLGGKHNWITQTNGEYTKTVCSKCRTCR